MRLDKPIITLNRVYAFFRLDATARMSYKLWLVSDVFWMFAGTFTYGFFGEITQSAQARYMAAYGNMNAATFIMIGIMLSIFIDQSYSAPQSITGQGNIERILLTPCSVPVFVIGASSWTYFWSSLQILAYVLVGTAFFGMNLFSVNWPTLIVIILIGIAAMWGLGIIGSSIQMVTKQWNPVSWFIGNLSFLVSGLFYSPEALLAVDPTGILYRLAWCLPQTYIYHMARLAFVGQSILDMLLPFATLAILTLVLFGIGLLTFRASLRKCRSEGSLGWV
jgi:ABC-type multidrug transport system permease subunit